MEYHGPDVPIRAASRTLPASRGSTPRARRAIAIALGSAVIAATAAATVGVSSVHAQGAESICGPVEYVWDAGYNNIEGVKVGGNVVEDASLTQAEYGTLQLANAGYPTRPACVSAVRLSSSQLDVRQASVETCVEVQEVTSEYANLSTGVIIPFSAQSTVTLTATPGRVQSVSLSATDVDVTLTRAAAELCPEEMRGEPPPGPSQYDAPPPADPALVAEPIAAPAAEPLAAPVAEPVAAPATEPVTAPGTGAQGNTESATAERTEGRAKVSQRDGESPWAVETTPRR